MLRAGRDCPPCGVEAPDACRFVGRGPDLQLAGSHHAGNLVRLIHSSTAALLKTLADIDVFDIKIDEQNLPCFIDIAASPKATVG